MEIAYGNRIWKSRMEIAHGNDVPAQVSKMSIRRTLRESHMEIAYGNRVWKSRMEIAHGNDVPAQVSKLAPAHRFHARFPYAISIRDFHMRFPYAIPARSAESTFSKLAPAHRFHA